MARQGRSGRGSAPSRPSVAPRPAVAPKQQTRPATTAAYPPATRTGAPPAAPAAAGQQSQGSGLFGQMASTAAGVAVGSTIGHALGGFFGGGSSAPAEQQQQDNSVASQGQANSQDQWGSRNCDVDAKQFTKCLDDNQGNMQICGWYLEQLKACQSAASQY